MKLRNTLQSTIATSVHRPSRFSSRHYDPVVLGDTAHKFIICNLGKICFGNYTVRWRWWVDGATFVSDVFEDVGLINEKVINARELNDNDW